MMFFALTVLIGVADVATTKPPNENAPVLSEPLAAIRHGHGGPIRLGHAGDDEALMHRSYDITCCEGGQPHVTPLEASSDLVAFTHENHGARLDDGCNRFTGEYTLNRTAVVDNDFGGLPGVSCKCPSSARKLDRNCRYLPACKNGGYRAFRIGLRCVCPDKYFGERCEHYCEFGRLTKKHSRDICECSSPYIKGTDCSVVLCLNGGRPVRNRRACLCQLPYLGRHCEHRLNRTVGYGVHESGSEVFHRDISGSIISLLLVIGLIAAIYFLIRRRVQRRRRLMLESLTVGGQHGEANRQLEIRREMLRTANTMQQSNVPPSKLQLDALRGPPPYFGPAVGAASVVASSYQMADLPPLPTYDDAIKCATSLDANSLLALGGSSSENHSNADQATTGATETDQTASAVTELSQSGTVQPPDIDDAGAASVVADGEEATVVNSSEVADTSVDERTTPPKVI